MQDIQNKEDLTRLVTLFYEKAIPDPIIGHFFTTVVKLSWEEHIPIIVSFWDTVLFGTGTFTGNPMSKHFALNDLSPMHKNHFDRWVELWVETIHEHFEGPNATEAEKRGRTIALLMQHKISGV